MKNVLQKIQAEFPHLSKKHQMLANYILQHPTETAFMTSVQLAKAAQVSNATVTRFSTTLAFEGFQKLQDAIRKENITHYSSMDEVGKFSGDGDSLFESMLDAAKLLPSLYGQRSPSAISGAVSCILGSEKVLVSGYQWCETLANYTWYELGKFKKNVFKLQDSTMASYDLIHENPEKSCAIIFGLPRYPKKLIDQIKRLQAENIPIILFTDDLFPLAQSCQHLFTIPMNGVSLPTVFPLLLCMLHMQEIISRVILEDGENAKIRVSQFERKAQDTFIALEDLL